MAAANAHQQLARRGQETAPRKVHMGAALHLAAVARQSLSAGFSVWEIQALVSGLNFPHGKVGGPERTRSGFQSYENRLFILCCIASFRSGRIWPGFSGDSSAAKWCNATKDKTAVFVSRKSRAGQVRRFFRV